MALRSHEFLEREGDDAVLLMPFDWGTEEHSPAFERASEYLARTANKTGAESYEERTRMVCDPLTVAQGLKRVRSSRQAWDAGLAEPDSSARVTQNAAVFLESLFILSADSSQSSWGPSPLRTSS